MLYRHELRFFHPTAVGIMIDDTLAAQEQEDKAHRASHMVFARMGHQVGVDLLGVRSVAGSARTFADAVRRVREHGHLPFVLLAGDPEVMAAGLEMLGHEQPLIGPARRGNWQAMAALAAQHHTPLVVEAEVAELAGLAQDLEQSGLRDLVLAPRSVGANRFSASVADLIRLRETAVHEGRLGYPLMAYPVEPMPAATEVTWASALTAKYASLILLNTDEPSALFPLLTLRQSVYTDPTVPAVVEPGLYVEGKPDEGSAVMLTGNFAMTYSMVSSDIRSANINAYLLVADAKGYSIGVACLLGTVTPENVAALIDETGVRRKVKHTCLIIPGLMASLKDKIQQATGMEVLVGPIDSRFIPSFMETSWRSAAKEPT